VKVFVTGGTRVLGLPVVRLLVEHGHTVRTLSRTDNADQMVRALGSEPVRAHLFDPAAVRAAVGNADAVLHLATRIPSSSEMGNANIWHEPRPAPLEPALQGGDRLGAERAECARGLADAGRRRGAGHRRAALETAGRGRHERTIEPRLRHQTERRAGGGQVAGSEPGEPRRCCR
jgi:hypothetical protein